MMMSLPAVILVLSVALSLVDAFVPSTTRSVTFLTKSAPQTGFVLWSTKDDEDDEETPPENPYADANYPDLEFVNYDDPEYQVDMGDEFYSSSTSSTTSTEEEIEAMREDRRRRNDEYQFQTYFAEILKGGDEYKGEWTIYKTSTFLNDMAPDANGLPRLVKAATPLKVVSSAYKTMVETDSPYAVDKERICHEERVVTGVESDPYKSWQADVDTDSGFGRHSDEDEEGEEKEGKTSPEAAKTEAEIMSNKYWPDELRAFDFRGHQGIMCVGNAYTIATAVPLDEEAERHVGPFAEKRVELGVNYKNLRFRIKLDYSIRASERKYSSTPPPLHLKSLVVCRESKEMWPRSGKMRSVADRFASEALFGAPGADGGLYDPPPVGDENQATRYMLLDLEGRATVLFPYLLDQDPEAFNGNGWVWSLDWTPGPMRYQADRKVLGGPGLLGLRTLELSEVQSIDADTYRPRDGGSDMRQ